MSELRRAVAAEAYGTFLLTMLGPGTIIAMTYVGLFSFASPAASLGFIGLAHGVALIVAFYSIGHVSGAHINPAVTISAWATHRVEKKRVAPYLFAQFVGATVAGFVLLVLWSSSPATLSAAKSVYLGGTFPGDNFGQVAALIAEIIATAILVFTIFGTTDKKANQPFAGLPIGLVLSAIIWIFGPISGASLNPARTFGPALASLTFSSTPLSTLWIYFVGPVLGGLLGAFLYDIVKPE